MTWCFSGEVPERNWRWVCPRTFVWPVMTHWHLHPGRDTHDESRCVVLGPVVGVLLDRIHSEENVSAGVVFFDEPVQKHGARDSSAARMRCRVCLRVRFRTRTATRSSGEWSARTYSDAESICGKNGAEFVMSCLAARGRSRRSRTGRDLGHPIQNGALKIELHHHADRFGEAGVHADRKIEGADRRGGRWRPLL